MDTTLDHRLSAENNHYDGIVKCPSIDQYQRGGIFYYEVVICANAITLSELTALMAGKFPITATDNFDGSLTVRGFRCIVYGRDRALFEGAYIVNAFREATKLELAIVETKHLLRQ